MAEIRFIVRDVGFSVFVVDGLGQQSCCVSVREAGALSADPVSQRL